MTVPEKISALRAAMKARGIYACIICTEDFHGSEYVGAHFRLREFLSGFTGSAESGGRSSQTVPPMSSSKQNVIFFGESSRSSARAMLARTVRPSNPRTLPSGIFSARYL